MRKHLLLILALAILHSPLGAAENTVALDLTQATPNGDKPVLLKAAGEKTVAWSLPDGKGRSVTFDLKAMGIDPKAYDEIRFALKPMGDPVQQKMTLYGHLEGGAYSRWYQKAYTPVDQWTEFRYDLHLDDDGIFGNPKRFKPGVAELIVNLGSRTRGTPGEAKARRALIRNLRLVKRAISSSFDFLEVEFKEEGDTLAYVYPMRLENHTPQAQTVRLDLDPTGGLHHFSVSGPETVALPAGGSKEVPITLSIAKRIVLRLPALYAEPIYPKAWIEGAPDSAVSPLMGYRRYAMWGVVPAARGIVWTPPTFQAFLAAREKALPGIADWRKGVIRKAKAALKYDWPMPDFGPVRSGWGYTCKTCKDWLKHDPPNNPRRHVCRKGCGDPIEGDDRIDREGLFRYNGGRASNTRELALAWLLTGDDVYAEKAKKLFLDYSAVYDSLPIHGLRSTSGGARLARSTLHESYMLPRFAEAYTYMQTAPCLDDPEVRRKVVSLIRRSAANMARHNTGYGNQQAEHFRAYGTAGLAIGHWPLAALAVYGECGWHEVVENGYSEDGIAPEGAAYHKAVFQAMEHFAAYAHDRGVNLYTPRFERVFSASINAGLPVASYEMAYRVYGKLSYLPAIEAKRQRVGESPALHGLLGLPAAASLPARSTIMSGGGFVYLKQGNATDYLEIRLNYIRQFDRHEHDRLTTFFFQNGRQVDSTAGRIAYGLGGGWMPATAAHNCIVIDGQNSRASGGKLIAKDLSPEAPIAVVGTDPVTPYYEGVDQLRAIAIFDKLFVVFDRVVCKEPRMIDRYQWGPGRIRIEGGMKPVDPAPESLPATGRFSELQGGVAGKDLQIAFERLGRKKEVVSAMRMRVVSDRDLTAYRALTIGGWKAHPREVSFVRAGKVKDAAILAVFSLDKKRPLPELAIVKNTPQAIVFTVASAEKTRTVTIAPTAGTVTVK